MTPLLGGRMDKFSFVIGDFNDHSNMVDSSLTSLIKKIKSPFFGIQ
jgi:hypothetical protein